VIVSNQLLRIVKEEAESIDYGTIKITLNKDGPYIEISSERRKRIIKNEIDDGSYHKG
jgi:hypothetical protein